MRSTRSVLVPFALGTLVAVPLGLGAVTLPHLFSNGAMADANDVNANFAALKGAVDALEVTPTLYPFTGTIEFTPCGNTGPVGPTLANCVTSYASAPAAAQWLNVRGRFDVVSGVQFFRVPKTGTWTITAAGARSGTSTFGGLGISLTATFDLVAGEMVRVVVGQRGEGNAARYSGAGGASAIAVYRSETWVPLLVAGGGAGMSENSANNANTNRNAYAPGVRANETFGGRGSWYSPDYTSAIGHYWPGGGGGGWASDGDDGGIGLLSANMPVGGRALSSVGPFGGRHVVTPATTYDGGFGGGGATGYNGGAAGGGGGWWGGNATFAGTTTTSDDTTHLGGGSYSMNPTFTNNGTTSGEGFVRLTL